MRIISSALFFFLAFIIVLEGQVIYPVTARIVWDRQDTETIENYVIKMDGNNISNPTYSSACAPTIGECSQNISIPDANSHTACVAGRNMWGTSTDMCVTFAARAPGRSNNIRIVRP